MENSFFYFFSATSQVLAALLALFGVFILFKIQVVRKQLFGIGQSVIDELNRPDQEAKNNKEIVLNINPFIESQILKSIHKEDMSGLSKSIIEIVDLFDNDSFNLLLEMFNDKKAYLNSIIKQTIEWSIDTAILIVFCIAVIPFSEYLLNHSVLLIIFFTLVIIAVSICFYKLISILKESLNE